MSQLIYLNLSQHMEILLGNESTFHAVNEQINFWIRLGKACVDNPELPTSFVVNCLASLSEAKSQAFIPFIPRAAD